MVAGSRGFGRGLGSHGSGRGCGSHGPGVAAVHGSDAASAHAGPRSCGSRVWTRAVTTGSDAASLTGLDAAVAWPRAMRPRLTWVWTRLWVQPGSDARPRLTGGGRGLATWVWTWVRSTGPDAAAAAARVGPDVAAVHVGSDAASVHGSDAAVSRSVTRLYHGSGRCGSRIRHGCGSRVWTWLGSRGSDAAAARAGPTWLQFAGSGRAGGSRGPTRTGSRPDVAGFAWPTRPRLARIRRGFVTNPTRLWLARIRTHTDPDAALVFTRVRRGFVPVWLFRFDLGLPFGLSDAAAAWDLGSRFGAVVSRQD